MINKKHMMILLHFLDKHLRVWQWSQKSQRQSQNSSLINWDPMLWHQITQLKLKFKIPHQKLMLAHYKNNLQWSHRQNLSAMIVTRVNSMTPKVKLSNCKINWLTKPWKNHTKERNPAPCCSMTLEPLLSKGIKSLIRTFNLLIKIKTTCTFRSLTTTLMLGQSHQISKSMWYSPRVRLK